MTRTMTLRTALRLADAVQTWVHVEGTGGFCVDVPKSAVARSGLPDAAPVGSDDFGGIVEAFDERGALVWCFDGSVLRIG